jgi:hypothetical protein
MSVLTKLLQDLISAKKSISDRAAELTQEIQDTFHQQNALTMAPTARSDVESMLRNWVAEAAAEFHRGFAERLAIFASDSRALNDPRKISSFVTLVGHAGVSEEAAVRAMDCALCAAHGDAMLAAMLKSLNGMEWPANPMSATEKAAKLKRLAERMEGLQAEQADLFQRAQEAGINLG